MGALFAVLRALRLWTSKLPPVVLFVALGLCGAAGAAFWINHAAFRRGELAGERAEKLRTLKTAVARDMATRDTIAAKVASKVATVDRMAPKVRAAHDAAFVIDSTHVAVRVTPTSDPDTVQVPAPVVARILTDSLALAERDSLIVLLKAQTRADSATIVDLSAENKILEASPASAGGGSGALSSVVSGAATGAAIGGIFGGGVGALVGAPSGAVLGMAIHVIFRR